MAQGSVVVRRPKWNDGCIPLICGIANAGGGTLVIPAVAKDYASGMRKLSRLLDKIPLQTQRAIGVAYYGEPVMDGAQLCLEIIVPPSDEPMACNGTFYYFNGTESKAMSEAEIKERFATSASTSYETRIQPSVEESAMDYDLLLELDSSAESLPDLLVNLGLRDGRLEAYTNAGVILGAQNPERFIPGASTRIGLFGAGSHDLRFQDEIVGPLPRQLSKTLQLLKHKYMETLQANAEYEILFPPEEALKEALLNALIHKDYEAGSPVRISVYTNRICVENLGSIPESWTIEDFVGDHSSRPRNPLLAGALKRLGLFSGIGNGIARMRHNCTVEDVPEPIFDARSDETRVTFFLTEKQAPTTDAPVEPSENTTATTTAREATDFERSSVAAAHNINLSLTDEYVLKIFKKNGRATAPKIAQILGISESTVRRSFRRLVELGFIERIGSNKTGYWRVLK